MQRFKTKKLMILPLLLFIASCSDITNTQSSILSSIEPSITESSHRETTEESSTLVSEITESTEEVSEVSEEASNTETTTSVNDSEEEVPSGAVESSEIISSSEPNSEPDSEPSSELEPEPDPEPEPEPGIYLTRTRIGVAVGRTTTIEYEVYPHDLGEVTWELIPDDYYSDPATVTPDGQVAGVYYTSDEYQIKGTLLDFEVYVTLTIFLDFGEPYDTFYPSYTITDAIGRGNRYHNGTSINARLTALRSPNYFAFDLKAGMTFNVMGFTRYKYDRGNFYYEFGQAINEEFVTLKHPFISDDGEALLLSYDISEDGEYMVRVRPHEEITASKDEVSYFLYPFWF